MEENIYKPKASMMTQEDFTKFIEELAKYKPYSDEPLTFQPQYHENGELSHYAVMRGEQCVGLCGTNFRNRFDE
jgi:hypothetical protein